MDNNKESHIAVNSKRIKDETFIGALESDYELNKSRLQKLKWKSLLKLLKENFGLILFFIYGLGAFIQVLELSRIDLSYLRFFSVTQLASDGALVFVTLAIFSFFAYTYYFCVTIRFRYKKELTNTIKNNVPLFVPLLFLLIVSGIAYTYLSNYISIEEQKRLPIFFLIFPALSVAILAFLIKDSKYNINRISNENVKTHEKYLKKFILIFVIILSGLLIPLIIMKTFMAYSLILREPKDFENYSKVGLLIKEQHEDVNSFKLLYFNDKYTFIKLNRPDSNKNTIEVYKTDAILFDEMVIKIKD